MTVYQPSDEQTLKLRLLRHRHQRECVLIDAMLACGRMRLGSTVTVDVMMTKEMLMRAGVTAELRQKLLSLLPFTLVAVIYFLSISDTKELLAKASDR